MISPQEAADQARLAVQREDFDRLAAKVVDLMASGDGVEPGFRTTEFWLTVLAVVTDVAGPYLNLSLTGNERMLIAAGLVGAYAAFRSWRKANGPAKLWASALVQLAAVSKAAGGKVPA